MTVKRSRALIAAACALGLSACGASTRSTTVYSSAVTNSSVTTVTSAAPLAADTTPSSAPTYCQTLTGSAALRGLGAAMAQLAKNANDSVAHATVRQAAASLRRSAAQTSGNPRSALLAAAGALDQLDRQGLKAAGTVNSALQSAGATLEQPCAFPVG
jgi:hypothetical protein